MKTTTSKGQQIEITVRRDSYAVTIDGVASETAECINTLPHPVQANGQTYVASLKRIALTSDQVATLRTERAALDDAHYSSAPMQALRVYDAGYESIVGAMEACDKTRCWKNRIRRGKS